ncbi:MAG: class I adenylate-forming enzyme family protein [Nannocystaceae bacterium]|nr:AMP-binding protein [bacterium]
MLTLDRISCVGEALRDAMVTFKTNTALIEADRHRENGQWTYRQLKQEAERFAALVQTHGFEPGDRCAIIMQNQSKWVMSGLGGFWAGGVLVPIDYKLTEPEQLVLLRHCKPKVLVTEYATWRKMQKEDLSGIADTLVLVTEAPEGAELGQAQRWEQEPGKAFTLHHRTREDVAAIVYSSGTSGTAKGCMLTHDNYLVQAQVLGRLYPIAEDERFFSILPTNHAIDFMVGFMMPLMMGAAIVHQRSLRPQFIRSALKQYEITHIALVPTILKNLEKRIRERLDDLDQRPRQVVDAVIRANDFLTARKPNHTLSRWMLKPIHDELGGKLKNIFAGGTFVDRKLVEFFYELGIPVAIGYGLTEATTVIAVNDLEPFRSTTVGKPVDGVEVEIRNPNDEGVGEVWVRGRTVMKGYLDAPELTEEAIVDGWLRTGDLGSVDISGHLTLRGRAKNMIVTEGGKNIYPEDIEAVFDDLPGCEELCVFAANYIWPTSSMLGEELVVVLRPESDADVEAMVQELSARNRKLPDFKRVSGYIVRKDDFPATASLKIKRNVLAEELRALDRAQLVTALEG